MAGESIPFFATHVFASPNEQRGDATGCITPEEAYAAVEWKAIMLVGSMLTLGAAMDHTGAAAYLAGQIVALVGGAGQLWLLSGFFALTVLLTQPMSNQAAAIVIIPIAI